MNKTGLDDIRSKVEYLLEKYPDTRDNDEILYIRLAECISADTGKVVESFYKMLSKSGLPKIETVSRCRRKAQEMYPDLKGSVSARERRGKNRAIYEEFARE